MKKLVLLLSLLSADVCFATVRVAFFEAYNPDGTLVRMEKGGRFFHAALELEDGRWLHAHPARGVEVIKDLSKLGTQPVVLINDDYSAVKLSEVRPFEGLPFDFGYVWENTGATYCAKLIAQILGLPPLPMNFESEFWEGRRPQQPGMGLSPDDIYALLMARDFREETWRLTCEKRLTPVMAAMVWAK